MADEYRAGLVKAFEEFQELLRKRAYLDAQIANKKQYIRAAIRQVSVQDQYGFEEQLEMLTKNLGSLSEAVREALRYARVVGTDREGFVTATRVRDLLFDSGFDFSSYKSNPLSSIHTALTRLKPDEVETEVINKVMHFRWKGQYTLGDVKTAQMVS